MNLINYLVQPGDSVIIKSRPDLGHFEVKDVVLRPILSEEGDLDPDLMARFENSTIPGTSYSGVRKVME